MQDKRAVVTGAASGIGLAVARRLVAEGAQVLAVDRDRRGLEAEFSDTSVQTVIADLSSSEQRAEVIEAGTGADYLVNAAGVMVIQNIEGVTVDEWQKAQAVNAEAVFFLCQGIGFSMPPRSAIVNISSGAAKLANTTEVAVYAASKAAVLSVTRSFAYALAPRHVRVNAICPGIVETPMLEAFTRNIANLRSVSPEELESGRKASIPLGRVAEPEEAASLIWFLLTDESSYITGQAINLTGGYITW